MDALWKVAKKLPGSEEGIACEGTPLEKRTAKVAKKAFLFLGVGDAMVKLEASLAAARAIASKTPARVVVGKGGWVKVHFSDEDPPPKELAATWIAESHGLMAPAEKPSRKPSSRKKGKPGRGSAA